MNHEANKRVFEVSLRSHRRTKQVHRLLHVIMMKTVRAGLGKDKWHVNADLEKLNMTRKDSSLEEVQKP